MTLTGIVTATTAGKISWRVHDSGQGFWAVVEPNFRLDLVDGVYTLRKDGVTLDTQDDTDDVLKEAVDTYINSTKSDLISEFTSKLAVEA